MATLGSLLGSQAPLVSLRLTQTDARAQWLRLPSAFIRTTTHSFGTLCPTTVPSPSGVDTDAPITGVFR